MRGELSPIPQGTHIQSLFAELEVHTLPILLQIDKDPLVADLRREHRWRRKAGMPILRGSARTWIGRSNKVSSPMSLVPARAVWTCRLDEPQERGWVSGLPASRGDTRAPHDARPGGGCELGSLVRSLEARAIHRSSPSQIAENGIRGAQGITRLFDTKR
jgi:hypothetical protein